MSMGSVKLGLDIGTNSVGWSLIEFNKSGSPQVLIATGSHIFESVLMQSDIKEGKGETKAVERRNARQLRRQYERRRQRKNRIYNLLVRNSLLPKGEKKKVLPELDKAIRIKFFPLAKAIPAVEHSMPYFLRKIALDDKLELHELGRAIYHLAQRRGYLSNRKADKKDDNGEGKVQGGINELNKQISDNGARTLGEYFSMLDPEKERIRQRYTQRQMYIDEFNLIWESQKKHYPKLLTDTLKKDAKNAIFYQRPLRSVKHLIGECSLEKGEKKAPYYRYEAQRFRTLQMVNNLDVTIKSSGEIRKLSGEERGTLLKELEKGDVTMTAAKKLLGYKRTDKFNLERIGDKHLIGNRINRDMVKVFGEEWLIKSPDVQAEIILDINSIQSNKALKGRALKHYKLSEDKANTLLETAFEEGYCGLSLKAINKLMPLLEEGVPFMTARKEIFPDSFEADKVFDLLPITKEAEPLLSVRNPIVIRTLNEVRKVVNAIIKEYGKPDKIVIELARDLRNSSKRRKDIHKSNKARRKVREDATKKIISKTSVMSPSRDDILKYLLAEECNWNCPYTGKQITPKNLFDNPEFDIEHIIPFSRCLDDSFLNKTLCHNKANRHEKGGRTPYEVWGHSGKKWDDILMRVERFKVEHGKRNEKLRRFKLQTIEEFDSFCSRQLNDTRYASVLAMDYLGLLYGGRNDANGNQRVLAGNGTITCFLRKLWQLNNILGTDSKKTRDDHRHHAVDAIVTSLLSNKVIKMISSTAAYASNDPKLIWRILRDKFPMPWESFKLDVAEAVNNIIVSHRMHRKVRGALHNETIYSKKKNGKDGKKHHHKRVRVESLSKASVDKIADCAIKEAVLKKLDELGISDPAKAFGDRENHPVLYTPRRKQKYTPIHKVRIVTNDNPIAVGKGDKTKYVLPGNNHHIELFEVLDPKTGMVKKWDAKVVSLLEARQRMLDKKPVVQRDHGENNRFLFSLCGGDIIQLTNSDGMDYLYRVRGITFIESSGQIQISFVKNHEARPLKTIKTEDKKNGYKGEQKGFQLLSPDPMRKRKCRKVTITPLGQVRWAND